MVDRSFRVQKKLPTTNSCQIEVRGLSSGPLRRARASSSARVGGGGVLRARSPTESNRPTKLRCHLSSCRRLASLSEASIVSWKMTWNLIQKNAHENKKNKKIQIFGGNPGEIPPAPVLGRFSYLPPPAKLSPDNSASTRAVDNFPTGQLGGYIVGGQLPGGLRRTRKELDRSAVCKANLPEVGRNQPEKIFLRHPPGGPANKKGLAGPTRAGPSLTSEALG